YEERSHKGIGDFKLTSKIVGYWDKGNTEIDFVALNENEKRIRFASCKRSPENLLGDVGNFAGHVGRFLESFQKFKDWRVEKIAVAPSLNKDQRTTLQAKGLIPESLDDLVAPLRK